jgi:hypothetical protein
MFSELEYLDQVILSLNRYSAPKLVSIEVSQRQFDDLKADIEEKFQMLPEMSKCQMKFQYQDVSFIIYNKDCITNEGS